MTSSLYSSYSSNQGPITNQQNFSALPLIKEGLYEDQERYKLLVLKGKDPSEREVIINIFRCAKAYLYESKNNVDFYLNFCGTAKDEEEKSHYETNILMKKEIELLKPYQIHPEIGPLVNNQIKILKSMLYFSELGYTDTVGRWGFFVSAVGFSSLISFITTSLLLQNYKNLPPDSLTLSASFYALSSIMSLGCLFFNTSEFVSSFPSFKTRDLLTIHVKKLNSFTFYFGRSDGSYYKNPEYVLGYPTEGYFLSTLALENLKKASEYLKSQADSKVA